MPDLLTRPALPYTTRHGLAVEQIGSAVYIDGRWCSPTDALDLSAVIARAVTQAAGHTPNHEGA
ncbi:hypothetical protein [Micromonospora wenchangensis]|uniref:hypothetical protein n=1 Tax=Micromonospora wenchangensis TaxID=1185415 RepID=UPI0037FD3832